MKLFLSQFLDSHFNMRHVLLHTAGCISTVPTTAGDEVSKCYPVNNKNYCFYTSGSVLSWNEAREFCVRRNSTLPIIANEDSDKVFQRFIASDSYSEIQKRSVWIGAHARPFNETVEWYYYHWINGRPSGLCYWYCIIFTQSEIGQKLYDGTRICVLRLLPRTERAKNGTI